MHQTQSKEHILALEFFKDSIESHTEKHFKKFIENPTQIYAETFNDDTLTPLLTNRILFFKTLIIKNRLSKLWTCVAECINVNTRKLCDVYSKEINFEPTSLSPQQQQQHQQPYCVIRDKDLANINLYKIQLITLSFEACVKGLNDASVYWDNNLFFSEINDQFKRLKIFCLMKSNGNQILNNFIENYLLKLPEYINSKYTKFNVDYIKWICIILIKNDLCNPNSELHKKINRIIEMEKVLYNNAFDKMKQASKENRETRFSRSRGTSFDKAEFTSMNCGGSSSCCDNNLFKKNYTLDKYFKKTQQQQQQQQQPQLQQQQQQQQSTTQTETNNTKNTSFKGLNLKYNINTMNNTTNTTNTRVIPMSYQHDINTNSSFTFTFNNNNNNNTIAIGNSYEENSSSQLSIRKHFNSNTSFSLQSDYTSTGDDALSYTKCYSSSGINSLLKTKHSHSSSSIGHYYPTISSHKPKAKDYKNSLHQKITAKLAKMAHSNNENINININITTIKKKEINENMKWMDDNFYKVSTHTTASSTLNSSTNDKHINNNVLNSNNTTKTSNNNNNNNSVTTSNKKTHSRTNNIKTHHSSNEDILAYKTPIKSNGILSKKIFDKGSNRDISPGTTRKNLLQLFQQVNK